MAHHDNHVRAAEQFQIKCTSDAMQETCLEFPYSTEYVINLIKGMYTLPPDDCSSPTLAQLSTLALKGESPGTGNFSRTNRARAARRVCRHEEARIEGQELVANSPQPSEVTTTSSNSDSGIGFHNDCQNLKDRIVIVDFVGNQPPPIRVRTEMPRRPMGLSGISSFDADGYFLSNTTPVVDGFGGQGRPLNDEDLILNANELRHMSPRNEQNTKYNNIYVPVLPRTYNGIIYDQVYTENEGHYELMQSQIDMDGVSERFNTAETEEHRQTADCQSNESFDNLTVISGAVSKASMDSVSVYSSRSHEEARPARRRHLQSSLDDMLVLGLRDPPPTHSRDDDNFVHPASVKCKVRKSKLNLLSKYLTGRERDKEKEARRRAISASAGDVTSVDGCEALPAAASEPDLRDSQSEQSSPFRRWTTGSGGGSSYRQEHRTIYTKQISEGASSMPGPSGGITWSKGGVARWSLGLEQLLADPVGTAAFAHFLAKEFAHENIRFWWSCDQYTKSEDPERRTALATEIWQRYLADGATEPVNVDAPAKRAAALKLCQDPLPIDLFQQAQKQIFNVMKFDSYPRFLRSAVHAECARCELRGQVPPFLAKAATNFKLGNISTLPLPLPSPLPSPVPSPPPPPAHGPPGSATPKLKKSASNASERRRSGGVSLMPWRRAASRDRAAPAAASATAYTDTTVTDVVKQSAPGQCSLCRVVLPDGATSVVEVEASMTVRRLVDRLLHRRKLVCNAYGVVHKEPREGESADIDTTAPSTVLGGREVVVERRCVVRLDVGSRSVTVRCRAARRLAHVLPPVVARYAPLLAAAPVALLDNRVVPAHTGMAELDGKRLQVVQLSESGDYVRSKLADEDADSLSELALKIQDESPEDEVTSRITRHIATVHAADTAFEPVAGPSSAYGPLCGPTPPCPLPGPTSPCPLPGSSSSCPLPGPSGLFPGPSCPLPGSSSCGPYPGPSSSCGPFPGPSSSCGPVPGPSGVNSGGRVRAALRPGPPLHHHPPDFLENLRETQRQRLQNKNEPSPAPRTPPPLPPKPARTPTLV